MAYDQSVGPKEGKSAISGATRKRVFGGQPQQQGGDGGVGAGAGAQQGLDMGDQLLQQLYGGGGGGNQQDQTAQLLRGLLERWQPKERPSETLTTQTMLQDPVGYYNKMQSMPSNVPGSLSPFAPGGAFEGRMAADTMTPTQIAASQGRTAKNQWASQLPAGGSTRSGVNADELRQRLGYKTYM